MYTCYQEIIYAGINVGGWWAGVATFITGCFGVWAINRGVVITACVSSVVSTALAVIAAVIFDDGGLNPLEHADPTFQYCPQAYAATLVFDVVIGLISLTMFITTCISLLRPSCFNEISYANYRRQQEALEREKALTASSNGEAKAVAEYGTETAQYRPTNRLANPSRHASEYDDYKGMSRQSERDHNVLEV